MLDTLRVLRAHRLAASVAEQEAFYARTDGSVRIRDWQLQQFNLLWRGVRRDSPHYRRLAAECDLPAEFSSWTQFESLMPVVGRREVQSSGAAMPMSSRPPDYLRTTGGSTSEPVQLPAWTEEQNWNNADIWMARSWFGVNAADRLFMIWGHSHLLGRGAIGRLNGLRRRATDALCGYRRYSAYDLSEAALRGAGEQLLIWRPTYVIGYAVALDCFARVNADRHKAFQQLGLKVVVATAEAFPHADSREVVAGVLGCPVAMEYGAVETSVIAHERPSGAYGVFWRHHYVEGLACPDRPGSLEIFVTSLFPRCFPLIRYRIGDLVVPTDGVCVGEGFTSVIGRCNDFVVASDGQRVHSEAFTHAVKESPAIARYQVVQTAEGMIELHYQAHTDLTPSEEAEIRRRLCLVNPTLARISMQRMATLAQTTAGKTRRVVREQPCK